MRTDCVNAIRCGTGCRDGVLAFRARQMDFQLRAERLEMNPSNQTAPSSWRGRNTLLPHSVEAERSVIGSVLLDNAAWTKVEDLIDDQDFYVVDHRCILQHIVSLLATGGAVDIFTVFESIQKSNDTTIAGGLGYLNEIIGSTYSSANIRQHAAIVREKSILRSVAVFCEELTDAAINSPGLDAESILDYVEMRVWQMHARHHRVPRERLLLASTLDQVMTRIHVLVECDNTNTLTGVASGYSDLDKITSGFQRGDLVVVAGGPGTRKTDLTLNIAAHVGVDLDLPVLIFTQHVTVQQVALRLLASRAHIELSKLQSGQLASDDWDKLAKGLEPLTRAKLQIDDSGRITIAELRAQTRRMSREVNGLGLIVIDDIELVGISNCPNTPEQRIDESISISRELKRLAQELAVPIIVCSSISSKIVERADRRPRMSDLRESRPIDLAADLVLLLYKDDSDEKLTGASEVIEIHIGKHRTGQLAVVRLIFNADDSPFGGMSGIKRM